VGFEDSLYMSAHVLHALKRLEVTFSLILHIDLPIGNIFFATDYYFFGRTSPRVSFFSSVPKTIAAGRCI